MAPFLTMRETLQVHELLEDLQAAYHAGQEHFLGAVVTTRQGDSPGEPYWVSISTQQDF